MKITISNVKCFGQERTFEFTRGVATLLSAPSGAGKTTIFTAIRAAIWGCRGLQPNFLKPASSKSKIVLIDDHDNVVERTWRPNTISFTRASDKTVYKGTDAEAMLLDLYGSSPIIDTFQAIALASDMKSADRLIGIVSDKHKALKASIRELTTTLAVNQALLDSLVDPEPCVSEPGPKPQKVEETDVVAAASDVSRTRGTRIALAEQLTAIGTTLSSLESTCASVHIPPEYNYRLENKSSEELSSMEEDLAIIVSVCRNDLDDLQRQKIEIGDRESKVSATIEAVRARLVTLDFELENIKRIVDESDCGSGDLNRGEDEMKTQVEEASRDLEKALDEYRQLQTAIQDLVNSEKSTVSDLHALSSALKIIDNSIKEIAANSTLEQATTSLASLLEEQTMLNLDFDNALADMATCRKRSLLVASSAGYGKKPRLAENQDEDSVIKIVSTRLYDAYVSNQGLEPQACFELSTSLDGVLKVHNLKNMEDKEESSHSSQTTAAVAEEYSDKVSDLRCKQRDVGHRLSEAQKVVNLLELLEKQNNAINLHQRLSSERQSLESRLAESTLNIENLRKLVDSHKNYMSKLLVWEYQMVQKETLLAERRAILQNLEKDTDRADRLRAQLNELKASYEAKHKEMSDNVDIHSLVVKLVALETERNRAKRVREIINDMNDQLVVLDRELAFKEDAHRRMDRERKFWIEWQEQEAKWVRHNAYLSQKLERSKRLEEINESMSRAMKELDLASKSLVVVSLARSRTMESVVNAVNFEINGLMERFFPDTDENMTVRLVTDGKKCEAAVVHNGVECKLSSLSTGEEARVKLAIDLAVRRVAGSERSPLPIIIDEGIANLNEELARTVVETIQSEFEGTTILFAAHQIDEGCFERVENLRQPGMSSRSCVKSL